MRIRPRISLLICLCLIFIVFGFALKSYSGPDSDKDLQTNVITASDAGGGDIKGNELVLIIIATIALVILSLWFIFRLMGMY